MFGKSGDRLIAALEAYRHDFAKRIRPAEKRDVNAAAALIAEGENILRRSGLGAALAPTLIEEICHWPSWSERDDFLKWVHFPATQITASEKRGKETKTICAAFTYEGRRFGVRFIDTGTIDLPDGKWRKHGTVDFLFGDETVLGLNISKDQEEHSNWTWYNLYTFKVGPWTKHLIEIAVHIEEGRRRSMNEYRDNDVIERAKNIKL